jgi:hypothetical protein
MKALERARLAADAGALGLEVDEAMWAPTVAPGAPGASTEVEGERPRVADQ